MFIMLIIVINDININNDPANILLKNELLTSRFRITDMTQIDIHCALASYLSKNRNY